jgi:LytS/YehU family sensor histidine kinase
VKAAENSVERAGQGAAWHMQPIGWVLFALVDTVARIPVYARLRDALLASLVLLPLVFLLAALLRAAYGRLGLPGRITLPAVPWIIGLSLAAALVVSGAGHALRLGLDLPLAARSTTDATLIGFTYYVMVFVIWSLVCFWITAAQESQAERQRALLAEAQAMRTEIQRLRLQLDPHFLFNALNGIGEEIPENPDAALAMLRDLAVFLRRSLAGMERPIVSVGEEAEALGAWLRVQQARFGARLAVRLEISDDAASRSMPSLLLQPLVENAIEHGARDPVLAVTVAIHAMGDALEALVTNSGGLGGAPRRGQGIGLDNVRRRLALHYPGRHLFTLEEREGHVVARLLLEGAPCSAW